jgi:hypothetical protein
MYIDPSLGAPLLEAEIGVQGEVHRATDMLLLISVRPT